MTDRALPARIVDLIREGVDPADLAARGNGAVWTALLSSACSAVQRGWSRAEWVALIDHPRSVLGRQVSLDRREQARPRVKVIKDMHVAWARAAEWVEDHPALTRADITRRIQFARDLAADAAAPLPENDRAVIAHGCDVGASRGTDRPAMPLRAVAASTALTFEQVRASLRRLDRTGLMPCEVRGAAGGPRSTKRRASCYRLPSRETVSVQPWGLSYLRRAGLCGVGTSMCGVAPQGHDEAEDLYVWGSGAPEAPPRPALLLPLEDAAPEALAMLSPAVLAQALAIAQARTAARRANVVPLHRVPGEVS